MHVLERSQFFLKIGGIKKKMVVFFWMAFRIVYINDSTTYLPVEYNKTETPGILGGRK